MKILGKDKNNNYVYEGDKIRIKTERTYEVFDCIKSFTDPKHDMFLIKSDAYSGGWTYVRCNETSIVIRKLTNYLRKDKFDTDVYVNDIVISDDNTLYKVFKYIKSFADPDEDMFLVYDKKNYGGWSTINCNICRKIEEKIELN